MSFLTAVCIVLLLFAAAYFIEWVIGNDDEEI